jgi:hypothetical protein
MTALAGSGYHSRCFATQGMSFDHACLDNLDRSLRPTRFKCVDPLAQGLQNPPVRYRSLLPNS